MIWQELRRPQPDAQRAKRKQGIAPVLFLSGAAILWRWGDGIPARDSVLGWLQFGTGLFAMFMAGAYLSGGAWERRAAGSSGGAWERGAASSGRK